MQSGDEPEAESAVVLAGGDPIGTTRIEISPDDLVIAADSGLHQARDLGLHVDLVVGDLDSVDPDVLDGARREGVLVESHPAAKDETDLELALEAARSRGVRRVTVLGGGGGRLDHLVAGLLVLASPRFASMQIRAVTPQARITVVRSRERLEGSRGSLVTLLAVGGPAHGVTTSGLRFPLAGETLEALSTRGVSNEIDHTPVTVSVNAGVLLAIQPEGGWPR